ncbi:MAG: hypothetical protein NTX50_25060 [Candidatus Sumerlaeota bacterium]|nr:hypothetical protein [Candidatus Sumerlaeota bacterium]
MNHVNELLAKLPHPILSPPINRLIIVSFWDKDSWVTFTYDDAARPPELIEIHNIISERFETANRRSKNP